MMRHILILGMLTACFLPSRSSWAQTLAISGVNATPDVDQLISYNPFSLDGNTVVVTEGGKAAGGLHTEHPFTFYNQGFIQGTSKAWALDLGAGGQIMNQGTITFDHQGITSRRLPIRILNEGTLAAAQEGMGAAVYAPRAASLWLTNKTGALVSAYGPALVVGGGHAYINNEGTIKSGQEALLYTITKARNANPIEDGEPPISVYISNKGDMVAHSHVFAVTGYAGGKTAITITNSGLLQSRDGSVFSQEHNDGTLSLENSGTMRVGNGAPTILIVGNGISHITNRGIIDAGSHKNDALVLKGGTHYLELHTGSRIVGKMRAQDDAASTLILRGTGELPNSISGFRDLVMNGQAWQLSQPHAFQAIRITAGTLHLSQDLSSDSYIAISPGAKLYALNTVTISAQHINNSGTIGVEGASTVTLRGPLYHDNDAAYEIGVGEKGVGAIALQDAGAKPLPPYIRVVAHASGLVAQNENVPIITSDTIFQDLEGVRVHSPNIFLQPELSLSEDRKTVMLRLQQRGEDVFVAPELQQNQQRFGRALSRAYRAMATDGEKADPSIHALFDRMLTVQDGNLAAIGDAEGIVYANVPYTMAKTAERLTDVVREHLSNNGTMLMKNGVPFSVWTFGRLGQETRGVGHANQERTLDITADLYLGIDGFLKNFGTLGVLLGLQFDSLTVDLANSSGANQRAYMTSYSLTAYGRNSARNQYGLAYGHFVDLAAGAIGHNGSAQGTNLRGHLGGYQFFLAGTSGYNYLLGEQWAFYPFITFMTQFVHSNGATLDSVSIDSRNQVGLQSVLGVGIQEALCLCDLSDDVHYPFFDVNIGWQHLWLPANGNVRGTVASQPFSMSPVSVPHDLLVAQASVRFLFLRSMSASLSVSARTWPSSYLDLGLGLNVEYHW